MNTLAQRLVALREFCAGKRGQRAFARMVDIKQQSVSNYERGSTPSAHVLSKIVLKTGCSAEWLLVGRGPMFPGAPKGEEVSTPAIPPTPVEFLDARGNIVTSTALARIMQIEVDAARSLLTDAEQSFYVRAGLPLLMICPSGKPLVLRPQVAKRTGLEGDPSIRNITINFNGEEVVITVPLSVLNKYPVRIQPETDVEVWPAANPDFVPVSVSDSESSSRLASETRE